ncbi:MAG TPA: hypothetical protein VI451_00580 [Anaerolineales bacterium]|nr:hypothetical protein [Anaerolineales bacterium]
MFDRYTRDPKRRIFFYSLIVLIIYVYQVYRTGWPTFQDVIIFLGLTFFGPFLPADIREAVPLPASISAILGDLVLFGLLFIPAMIFFAQFTLPLKHTRERLHAAWRLFLYLFDRHGPAIFINDGKIVRGERELEKIGPGVILLDTASAAVLQTAMKVTRVVGPGVAFLGRFEKVGGIVDLHRQRNFFGPFGNEDPFTKNLLEDETPEDLTKRQERRWQTSALTRDGVEVVPNIFVLFRLERLPQEETQETKPESLFERVVQKYSRREEVESGFGYNSEAVKKAIQHTSIDPEESYGSDQRRVEWNRLPAFLAVEVWREHLRKFTFEELFTFTSLNPADRNRRTAFEIIGQAVHFRMTKETVEQIDEFGRPTGNSMLSPEYKLLKERGIEVLAALVIAPRFENHVDQKLFEQWQANWLERAREEARFVEQERSYAELNGAEKALANFADSASRLLGYHLLHPPPDQPAKPNLETTLEYMVRGSLDQCLRDPELHQQLANERLDLAGLIEWIRSN